MARQADTWQSASVTDIVDAAYTDFIIDRVCAGSFDKDRLPQMLKTARLGFSWREFKQTDEYREAISLRRKTRSQMSHTERLVRDMSALSPEQREQVLAALQ